MTIKTISGGRTNKEQWWNLNNDTSLLYLRDTMLLINNKKESWVVLKATLKRNDIPAFIEGYLSELNNINHGSTNSK